MLSNSLTPVAPLHRSGPAAATAYLPKKPVEIVVCVRQFMSEARLRGYEDIAHGVRIIQSIDNFRNRNIALVVEHHGDPEEKKTIAQIIDLPGVETLLISRSEPLDQTDRKKLTAWLDDAQSIIHGPAGIIGAVKADLQGRLNDKCLFLDEYDIKDGLHDSTTNNQENTWLLLGTGPYQDDKDRPIGNPVPGQSYATGFTHDMVYLQDNVEHQVKPFDNPFLRQLFESIPCSEKPLNNNPVYFVYHAADPERVIRQSLNYAIKYHSPSHKDVFIFTTISQAEARHALPVKDRPVRVTLGTPDHPEADEIMLGSGQQSRPAVHFITIPPVSNSDFKKLLTAASLVFVNGDISCSDTLSVGKIPLIDRRKKPSLFDAMKMSICYHAGGYSDCSATVCEFLDAWDTMSDAFSGWTARLFPKLIKSEEDSLLDPSPMDQQFRCFHKRYVQQIRLHNKLPGIINTHLQRKLMHRGPETTGTAIEYQNHQLASN